jgi:very-short-patch-repair endonuclease
VREETANLDRDAFIARLAANQHGVVSIKQLERAGIRRQSLTRRIKAGRLLRIHRGVYAVGHPGLSERGWWMAAVLAGGPEAVLSHTSAAALWEMLPKRGRQPRAESRPSVTHITVPTAAGRERREGIRIHRSRTLFRSAVTLRARIPVTTPSRTLADLRLTLPAKQFAAAMREAEFLRLPIDPALEPDGTRSDMEADFLGICRRHRLPMPSVNVRTADFEVDFVWPRWKLVVEVDGWDSHKTRTAFENDRARDEQLKLLGYEVIRFTWRRLRTHPAAVAATLRTLLRRGSAPGRAA